MCTLRSYAVTSSTDIHKRAHAACRAMNTRSERSHYEAHAPTHGNDFPFVTVYLPAEHSNHNAMIHEDPLDILYAHQTPLLNVPPSMPKAYHGPVPPEWTWPLDMLPAHPRFIYFDDNETT
jgi:hypothetical protein